MIFKIKKHTTDTYNTLLNLSRNLFFYTNIKLKDTYETRVYLMFFHFALILITFKNKKINFPQNQYDDLFFCLENNLRELGFGDVAVNKKMKELNKISYDILIKIKEKKNEFKINKNLVFKYFDELNNLNSAKYELFEEYFSKFYHFCFELHHETVIKDAIKFKV